MNAILGVPPKSCVLWTVSTLTILTQTNTKKIFNKKNIQMDKVHNTQLQGCKPCRAVVTNIVIALSISFLLLQKFTTKQVTTTCCL
jgi:hypothetical protein